ncbi:putative zinc ribbon protein [Klebsiella michiganensis]|uniref:putative zinc ribbon protein n=1 Tax=Klebsiella michiganensis TaxID=1134687 RepID=UPI003D08265B
MQKSILQDVKLYIAFDNEDRYIMANNVETSGNGQWFCSDCRCPLKLRNDTSREEAWFEHAPDDTTAEAQVPKCSHVLNEIRRRAFTIRLNNMVNGLDTLVTPKFWFCVWCQMHYKGEKHCKTCNTGIYSITRYNWSWDYNRPDDKSITVSPS